jgi:hypothetical protein
VSGAARSNGVFSKGGFGTKIALVFFLNAPVLFDKSRELTILQFVAFQASQSVVLDSRVKLSHVLGARPFPCLASLTLMLEDWQMMKLLSQLGDISNMS